MAVRLALHFPIGAGLYRRQGLEGASFFPQASWHPMRG